jgi:hypothetical protein
MFSVKADFDVKELQHKMEDAAGKAYFNAVERARQSIGAEGDLVSVKRLPTPQRHGDQLTFGEVSFLSESIRRRFEEAFRREFR